jgi:FAD/FMN-containing dehydrogenase
MPSSPKLIGYEPTSGRWIEVSDPADAFVTELDGELTLEPEAIEEASRDLGRERFVRAGVVLRPESVEDIGRVVARARAFGIPVAPQGTGHGTFGQRLVRDGIAIDMRMLRKIGALRPDQHYVEVDAGALWSDLIPLLTKHQLQFAGGLTGYLKLSVGGTLAVGGISNMPKNGAQIDAVLGLQVVTGRGDVVWCSPTENSELFNATVGGLGQVGIITRARLALTRLPGYVWSAVISYPDSATALTAARTAVASERFDEVFIMVLPPMTSDNAPTFNLHVARYRAEVSSSEDTVLPLLPEAPHQSAVIPYKDHVEQFTLLIDQWVQTQGWNDRVKPWFDAFLGDEAVDDFVEQALSEMTPDDWSLPEANGFVLLFPHHAKSFRQSRLRLPETSGQLIWLFDVLNVSVAGPDSEYLNRMHERNERWISRARAMGGKRYPIGTLVYSYQDWQDHYGALWPEVARAKQRFDPSIIMTPGQGIFPRS